MTVLTVHGSRNPGWVALQQDWFAAVQRLVGSRADLRLTFLELNEPSLDSSLAAINGKVGSVSILPFFLSKSGHVAEEIPGIVAAALPDTPWQIIDPVGLDEVLGRNAERRLRAAGADPAAPVIVSGYGASQHAGNWLHLVDRLRAFSGAFASARWHFAPAGHFLADSSAPLRECLSSMHAQQIRRAAVLPLYLGVASYQTELIPQVLSEFPDFEVSYGADAVLPDPLLEQWAAERIVLLRKERW